MLKLRRFLLHDACCSLSIENKGQAHRHTYAHTTNNRHTCSHDKFLFSETASRDPRMIILTQITRYIRIYADADGKIILHTAQWQPIVVLGKINIVK